MGGVLVAQVLTKLAIIGVTAALLTGCGTVTVVDTTISVEELFDPTALAEYHGEQEISLEVIPPSRERITLVYDESVLSHYDYTGSVVPALEEGLSIPFTITSPAANVPHIIIAFGEIDAEGSCRTVNTTPVSCTQTVEMDAVVTVAQSGFSPFEKGIFASGSATDDDLNPFWAWPAFEPIHKRAANRAFGRLLLRAMETIREAIENPEYDSNQTAWLPGS